MFAHVGPWTEEESLALPVDRRIELLDGALLVSPSVRRKHCLRIEQGEEDPSEVAYRLEQNCYVEVARVDPGQPLVLTEPFLVTLDLAALAAATRPPGAVTV